MAFPSPFLLIAVLWAAPAEAQVVCGDVQDILAQLKDKYHEAPAASGVTSDGGLFYVLAADNGSWTIVLTSPQGKSCVVAYGGGWHVFRRPEPEA